MMNIGPGLADSVLEPIEAHVNGRFGSLLCDGSVGEPGSCGVVCSLKGCGWLWFSQFLEGVAEWDGFLAIDDKEGTAFFGFNGRCHYIVEDVASGVDGTMLKGSWLTGVLGRSYRLLAEEEVSTGTTASLGFGDIVGGITVYV
jgi:hypothetical protein